MHITSISNSFTDLSSFQNAIYETLSKSPQTLKGIRWSKIAIFHYCVYFKFVTNILFVAISQNFMKIE